MCQLAHRPRTFKEVNDSKLFEGLSKFKYFQRAIGLVLNLVQLAYDRGLHISYMSQ